MKNIAVRKIGLYFFQIPVIFVLFSASFSVNAADWSIQTVGNLTQANAINNSGQVAGEVRDGSGHRLAATYVGGQTVNLGSLDDGPTSTAYGINGGGQIVGSSALGGLDTNAAFSASAYSPMASLHVHDYPSIAFGVNDSGHIVGSSVGFFGSSQAFLYMGGTAINLGTLGSGVYSEARAINNKDQVIGLSDTTDSGDTTHAFLYDQGQMRDLGSLGGSSSVANALNDQGQIVGSSTLDNGLQHAFLYQNGSMADLFAGDSFQSVANGINARGEVIGIFGGGNHSFLYRNGSLLDLSTLADVVNAGWTDLMVSGINDEGQIVGTGMYSGQSHGFVLNAVPEPQTYALMLAGLAAVGVVVGRRGKGRLG